MCLKHSWYIEWRVVSKCFYIKHSGKWMSCPVSRSLQLSLYLFPLFWPRTCSLILQLVVWSCRFQLLSNWSNYILILYIYIALWNWFGRGVFSYCRCVLPMTALRRNTTTARNSSPGFLQLILLSLIPRVLRTRCPFLQFLPMNTVYTMGELKVLVLFTSIFIQITIGAIKSWSKRFLLRSKANSKNIRWAGVELGCLSPWVICTNH